MNETSTLIREIDAFLASAGMKQTAFGLEVLNDPALLTRLRAGGTVTLRTAEKIREYIATHPGDGMDDRVLTIQEDKPLDISVLLVGNRLEIKANVDADGLAKLKQMLDKYEEILGIIGAKTGQRNDQD
jgi:hypothetical protein